MSEYMIIGSAQRINKLKADPNLLIGNVKLKRVKSKKILDVVIDQSLGWNDHIDSVCKKGSWCIAKNSGCCTQRFIN